MIIKRISRKYQPQSLAPIATRWVNRGLKVGFTGMPYVWANGSWRTADVVGSAQYASGVNGSYINPTTTGYIRNVPLVGTQTGLRSIIWHTYQTSLVAGRIFQDSSGDGLADGEGLWVTDGGPYYLRTTTAGAGYNQWVTGVHTAPINTWYCGGFSHNQSGSLNTSLISYVDGKFYGIVGSSGAGSGSFKAGSGTISIGARQSDSTRVWPGSIRALYIFDSLLTEEEHLELALNPNAIYEPKRIIVPTWYEPEVVPDNNEILEYRRKRNKQPNKPVHANTTKLASDLVVAIDMANYGRQIANSQYITNRPVGETSSFQYVDGNICLVGPGTAPQGLTITSPTFNNIPFTNIIPNDSPCTIITAYVPFATSVREIFLADYIVNGSNASIVIEQSSSNTFTFAFGGNITLGTVTAGKLSKLALVRNTGTGQLQAFVDNLVSSPITYTTPGTGSSFRIGTPGEYGSLLPRGAIPYLFVWRRALTAEEIREVFKNPWQLFEPQKAWIPTDPSLPAEVVPDNNEVLKFKRKRNKQPQGAVGIDWSNPIAQGLSDALINHVRFTAKLGTPPSVSGTVTTLAEKDGLGRNFTTGANRESYGGEWKGKSANFTVLAFYRLTTTPPSASRVFSNFLASSYGWSIAPNNTNFRIIVASSGANVVLTGSAVGIAPKVDVITSTGTATSYYENGVLTASNASHTAIATPTNDVFVGDDGSGVIAAPCTVYMVAVWDRILSSLEIANISSNPWQLFTPRSIWVPIYQPAPIEIVPDNNEVLEYRRKRNKQPSKNVEAATDLGILYFGPTGTDLVSGRQRAVVGSTPSTLIPTEYGLAEKTAGGLNGSTILSTAGAAPLLTNVRINICGLITGNTSGTSRTYFLSNRVTSFVADRRGAWSIKVAQTTNILSIDINTSTALVTTELFALVPNKVMFLEIYATNNGFEYRSNYGSGFVTIAGGIADSLGSLPPSTLSFGYASSIGGEGHTQAALLHFSWTRAPRKSSLDSPWEVFKQDTTWVPIDKPVYLVEDRAQATKYTRKTHNGLLRVDRNKYPREGVVVPGPNSMLLANTSTVADSFGVTPRRDITLKGPSISWSGDGHYSISLSNGEVGSGDSVSAVFVIGEFEQGTNCSLFGFFNGNAAKWYSRLGIDSSGFYVLYNWATVLEATSVNPARSGDTLVVVSTSTSTTVYTPRDVLVSSEGAVGTVTGRIGRTNIAGFSGRKSFLFAITIPKSLSTAEVRSYLANPWQVFKSEISWTPFTSDTQPTTDLAKYTRTWKKQPQEITEVDWTNPITKDLVSVDSPLTNLVQRTTGTGNSIQPTRIGVAYVGNGLAEGFYKLLNLSSFDSARATVLALVMGAPNATDRRTYTIANASSFILQIGTGATTSSKMRLWYRTPGADVGTTDSNAVVFEANKPHIAVLRYQSGSLDAFIDGVYDSSTNGIAGGMAAGPFWTGISGLYRGSLSNGTTNGVLLGAAWSRSLSNEEIASISANPWQLFKPKKVFAPVTYAEDATPRSRVLTYNKKRIVQPKKITEINKAIPRPAEFVNLAARLPFGSVANRSVLYGLDTSVNIYKEPGTAFGGVYLSSFVSSQNSLQGPDARFSVIARLRKTTTALSAIVTSRNNTYTGRTFALTDIQLRAAVVGTNNIDSNAFPSIIDGNYHTVGMTCDGTTTIFFIDGIEISSHAYAFAGYTTPNSGGRIGEANGWGLNFVGDIAFVADWHEPLHPSLMRSLTANPWQLFAPTSTYMPFYTDEIEGVPRLSNATIYQLLSTSGYPRVGVNY